MLDAYSALKDQLQAPQFDDKYSADQAIISAEFAENPSSNVLTVVFPPWHIPDWFLRRLKTRLLAKPSNILVYNFNPQILDDDPIEAKNSFEYIALAISEDIRELVKEKGFTKVDLLGLSLGNVALTITAEKLDAFADVLMIAPGSDLAASLWTGWRTRRLRGVLKREGYKLQDLEKEWDDLAPEKHIPILQDHKVHIVLAKKDRFIPYAYGKRLLDELLAVNPKVTHITKPFGHLATILLADY